MGSWSFIFEPLEQTLMDIGGKATRPSYAGRAAAASPATGSMKMHIAEQAQLVDDALTGAKAINKAANRHANKVPNKAKASKTKNAKR